MRFAVAAAPSGPSAESGRDSPVTNHGFHPGPPRRESKYDSSAEQPAGHAPDPARTQVARERGEACVVESGVAVALEDEIADPDDAVPEPAVAEHLGAHPERRAEGDERGVGDGELLVRGGEEGSARVVRVDRLPGLEIDRERRGAAAVEAGERRVQSWPRSDAVAAAGRRSETTSVPAITACELGSHRGER